MRRLRKQLQRNWLWGVYTLFVAVAVSTHLNANPNVSLFTSDGPYGMGKTITWLILLAFLFYSINISRKEDFFKSLNKMMQILWSRQVGLDLYVGLLVPLFIIYLHEGSLLVFALWVLPVLFFANLATFLYLALNYDSLVQHFVL
ncbi:MAG: hypothetical protein AAF431_01385 [Pseudomonadota bacterium]